MKHIFNLPNKVLNSDIFYKENNLELYVNGDKCYIVGECSFEQAQAALDAHNPPAPTEPTVAEKLASVGLSLEELKAALGGN